MIEGTDFFFTSGRGGGMGSGDPPVCGKDCQGLHCLDGSDSDHTLCLLSTLMHETS